MRARRVGSVFGLVVDGELGDGGRRLGSVDRRRIGIARDRRDRPLGDRCRRCLRCAGARSAGRRVRAASAGVVPSGPGAGLGTRGGTVRTIVLREVLHADAEHGEDRLTQVFARSAAGGELLELRDVGLALERERQHVALELDDAGARGEQPRRPARLLELGEDLRPGVLHVREGDRLGRHGRRRRRGGSGGAAPGAAGVSGDDATAGAACGAGAGAAGGAVRRARARVRRMPGRRRRAPPEPPPRRATPMRSARPACADRSARARERP